MKRRVLSIIMFVAVLLGYFLSEALLRRIVYYAPPKGVSGKKELIDRLPTFLRKYFEERQKIAELEQKLAAAKDVSERMSIQYELSGLVSESRRERLMRDVIAESPNSHKVARAWSILFANMTEEEIFEEYLEYVENCDIRRPRHKVIVWQTGLSALSGASRDTRMQYVRRMAQARAVSADFYFSYEELCSQLRAKGESAAADEVDELRVICQKKLQEANKPK